MNTTEINGFEIDNFNQYDLEVGKRDSTCPLCSAHRSSQNQKKKVALLDWERGLGTCNHCNEVFQLHTFQRKGGGDKIYVKPNFAESTLPTKVLEWFSSRGISSETLSRLKVGCGKEWMPQTQKLENTIQFNYFIGEELINIKYRDGAKNFKLVKDAEKVFYNLNSIVNSDTVVIVEGEMDVLALVESGITNAVSVPNGATLTRNNLDYLDNCIDYFSNKEKVIIAVDSDEAGAGLQSELIRRLGAELCYTVDFGDSKDANECLTSLGADKLRSIINSAIPVPLEHVVTVKSVQEEVNDFFVTGGPSGFKAGIPGLDEIFSVLPGQYCVVTAVPTAGKTFFIDQYALGMNKQHGWKVAVASPETKPDWIAVSNLVRKQYGDFPDKISTGSQKYEDIMNHLNDNFFFIDMEVFSLENVLSKATELVKRKGIKMLVIDPINRVRDKRNDNISEYTISYFNKVDQWAKKNNCFVMLAAHPHKINKLENGEWPDMNYYNIAGGADIANMAYHILAMNRSFAEDFTSIKVLKCKYNFLGKNGEEVKLKYDIRSTNFHRIDEYKMDSVPWDN